jgi:hypothetical protein
MSPLETAMPIPMGIFADSGLSIDALDPADVPDLVQSRHEQPVSTDILEGKANGAEAHYGTFGDVDPNDLSEAGWSILYGPTVDQRIKDALRPLIDHRKSQVGDDNICKIFDGPSGFRAGDTADTWLARQKVRMDVVVPLMGVPFYILIVASPEEIPFEFQYSLDLYWGVGRLWFDTPDEFRQYADSVVRYETMPAPPTSRQTAVFATCHDFDVATELFSSQVATPMATGAGIGAPLGQRQKFGMQSLIGDGATKDALGNVFTGAIPNGAPSLLFTGTHGVAFRPDDPRQLTSQGAPICQDWSGAGPVGEDQFFSASDLPSNAKVHGMIHVLFACYGAGYPQFDNFDRLNASPKQIAPKPSLGRLPQALLAHPDGGALAVLGHVERAWAFSFQSDKGGPQIQGFRDVLGGMLRGERLGKATDQFNQRWSVLSTELSETLYQMSLGLRVAPRKLASQWIARDDARNYILLGDPAVRLRVADMPAIASPQP